MKDKIHPILEKIFAHGFRSLTDEERDILNKAHRRTLNEYMKENPLKEEVVKKLFDAFDKLLDAPTVIPLAHSRFRFNMELDPLKYVDNDEYHMGVYDPLIVSFHETYIKKWKKDIDESYGYVVSPRPLWE